MKKSLKVAFLLFVVLSIVSAQDFSGGFMKHLQTGTLTAFVDDAAASVTKVNSSYSALFPRDNIFDDTDTNFFIGTCNLLFYFSIKRLPYKYYPIFCWN